jgi:ABC-type arginine/histidine transport system permease subunit
MNAGLASKLKTLPSTTTVYFNVLRVLALIGHHYVLHKNRKTSTIMKTKYVLFFNKMPLYLTVFLIY